MVKTHALCASFNTALPDTIVLNSSISLMSVLDPVVGTGKSFTSSCVDLLAGTLTACTVALDPEATLELRTRTINQLPVLPFRDPPVPGR